MRWEIISNYSGRAPSNRITVKVEERSRETRRKKERFDKNPRTVAGFAEEGAQDSRVWGLQKLGTPSAGSQPGNGDLGPIITRN